MFQGPAAVLAQLMLTAFGGWIGSYIARGLGKGNVASMIDTATTFICIGRVLAVVAENISKAMKVMP